MGGINTIEGTAARERATAVRRADHIMEIAGRLIDGRSGVSGAQYINTAKGVRQRYNNADFAGTTGSIRVTATGGIKKGDEILMPYGSTYWRSREAEARHDRRNGRRDARRGGMIAYTVHDSKRIVFIEEIVRSWEANGHKLQTGHALFSRVLDAVRRDVDEVHLIVRRDNVHARSLYGRIGCKEAPWVLYEPLSEEVYMVAQVSEMDRLIRNSTSVVCGARRRYGKWRWESVRRGYVMRIGRGRSRCTRRSTEGGANGSDTMHTKPHTYWCGMVVEWARQRA